MVSKSHKRYYHKCNIPFLCQKLGKAKKKPPKLYNSIMFEPYFCLVSLILILTLLLQGTGPFYFGCRLVHKNGSVSSRNEVKNLICILMPIVIHAKIWLNTQLLSQTSHKFLLLLFQCYSPSCEYERGITSILPLYSWSI